MTAFQSATSATRVLLILDRLSLKPDFRNSVALAAVLDEAMRIHGPDVVFTDGSALRRNGRGAYLAEQATASMGY